MSPLNVVIIGGSGNIGSIILQHLLKEPSFKVSALTRASSQATFPEHAKVLRTDYTEASLIEAFTGQDVVVSAVGATAVTDQKKYIDAAVKAGVKRFLPSEFGIDGLSKASQEVLPLVKTKIEVLDYLKVQEAAGLTWTALVTGLLFDWVSVASNYTPHYMLTNDTVPACWVPWVRHGSKESYNLG